MSFLKRLFGGSSSAGSSAGSAGSAGPAEPALSQAEVEALEQERERELLREESDRHDELVQRQMRYAQYAWTPPAQGGPDRAEDFERGGTEE